MEEKTNQGLSLHGVSYHYAPGQTILANLSFEIAAGEFVAVLGPSGCGKSTLIRLLAGLDQASQGQLNLSVPPGQRGVVFQEARLLPWRSVLANVSLPLQLQGHVAPAEGQRLATAAVAQVGLAEAAAKYPHELSGGMKMRVALARALVNKPSLLLLDEPFAALDERTRHALQDDLRQLWQNLGMTVVLVTHSLPEAVYLANRVLILSSRPARIVEDVAIGLPERRTSASRLEPAFQGELERLRRLMPTGAS